MSQRTFRIILHGLLVPMLLLGSRGILRASEPDASELRYLGGGDLSESESAATHPRSRYLRALQRLNAGAPEEARMELLELQTLKLEAPLAEAVALSLADAALVQHDWTRAMLEYQQFLDRFPRSERRNTAVYGLARAQQRAGLLDASRQNLAQIVQAFPTSFEAALANDLLREGLEMSVQVGAFQEEANARDVVKELSQQGNEAVIVPSLEDGATHYRVRVGRFTTYDAAEAVATRLREAGYSTQIVP